MVGALRLGYHRICCTFLSSSTRIFGLENPSRLITSKIPAAHEPNFTVSYLINSCGLSPQDAISISTNVKLQNPKRADAVLALLGNRGLSQTQISKFVRSLPRVLATDPEKILAPKIDFFINVGLSGEDLARVLTFNPQLLLTSLEKQIVPTYNFLRKLISKEQVVTVLKHRSWIFRDNLSKNIKPNIELLRMLGMPETCMSLLVAHYSHVLMHNQEHFAEVANEVKEMGFNVKKSIFLEALRALCGKSPRSRYNRNREIYKKSWGWSDDDVDSAFKMTPRCMIISEGKLMHTMYFLVNKMGWSTTMIVTYPKIFTYSLEKRIIPRCCVVNVLMSKGLIDENLSLRCVVQPTEKQFLERFVTIYLSAIPQLLSAYEGKLGFEDI